MERTNQAKGYDRYLSPVDVWAMAFGCMVGWGAFVMPGTTFLPVAGPAGTLIAMALSALLMLLIGGNFTYLMRRSQRTGGIYAFAREAFGRDHAFLCSWFLCLSYLTIVFLNSSALFIVIRTMFGSALQGGYHYTVAGNTIYLGEVALSILVVAGVGLLFVVAKAALQRLHTALSIVLAAGLLLISALCIPHALRSGAVAGFGLQGISPPYAVFSMMILAPWAFVGFEVISFDTAHYRFPIKKTGGIVSAAIVACAIAYASMSVASIATVPDGFASWAEYIGSLGALDGIASVPTFYAARAIMGRPGLWVAGITAVAAILTGIIGGYRATTRILATMAEDRILSNWFSRTSSNIFFVMVLSIAISLLGRNTLSWFVDLTSFGAIVGFAYTSAAAWKTARTENNRRVMVTGLIGTAVSVGFGVVQLVPRLTAMEAMGGEAFLLLSLWCLLGFLFYRRTITHGDLSDYTAMSTSGVVLFSLLLYSAIMWLAKLLMAQETLAAVRTALVRGGLVLICIAFVGLTVMLHIQNLVRRKQEESEREKIRAVEGSLAKSQFLFNMSHDIRTPMNAIIGYTNLARKEPASPAIQDYLSKIDASSQHLLSLINDILEMSRIESGKIELELAPTDLVRLFDDMRDLFAEQMRRKQMDFTVHASQVRSRYVWCDRKNLNRVLFNIISNAYKFTPEGGTITASLWESAAEEGYAAYEIRVQDSGIGMSREFAEKMFNAFERERTSTVSGVEGTGLGLAITKNLVELMGGSIEALTSPGTGTEMIIRLKLRLAEPDEAVPEPPEPAAPEANAVDFSSKRLLLVEDNAINLEIAKMILTQAGFTVETAENGKIAVDLVAASQPGYYDAILMDIQMPVMDGYEATRAIRALADPGLAQTPILAMTANAFKEDEQAAARAGMQAHIAKPIDVGAMLNTLADVLRQSGDHQ